MTTNSLRAAPPAARLRAATLAAPILLAALLGAFLLFGAGFAEMSLAHNAAHDMRHSIGFPCH